MPRIHRLPQIVADKIAAGEVVERPASVVKELMENAVDAGATALTVELSRGGITYIRVTDNGCGMDREDAETAFLRHATSKIRTEADLHSVSTLGFRGEALAAICAVSRVDLLTLAEGQTGVSVRMEGGVTVNNTEAGCPKGTTIIVRDLFYNTPARMKFLKRDQTEAAYAENAVRRAALSHPEIAFRLIRDGETMLQSPGDGDLRSCIYGVLGREFALSLTPACLEHEKIHTTGFVTRPSAARGNRAMQHFFVNGRPVQSRMLSAALEEGFKNSIPAGRFPGCVLHISLPGELVDVNIHPAKTEVKFAAERAVFDCVFFAVKNALESLSGRTQFEPAPVRPPLHESFAPHEQLRIGAQQPAGEAPDFSPRSAANPTPAFITSVPPVKEPDFVYPVNQPVAAFSGGTGFHTSIAPRPEMSPAASPDAAPSDAPPPAPRTEPSEPDWRYIGEAMQTYLIAEVRGENHRASLLLVDKHAAHERIIYEALRAADRGSLSQLMITPQVPALFAEETDILLQNRDTVQSLGFELEDFGGGSVLVRGAPHYIDAGDVDSVLSEIARKLLENRRSPAPDVRDALLYTVACKAAIKAGRASTPSEGASLLAQVMRLPDIKYCPHGRPVVMEITQATLERRFERT